MNPALPPRKTSRDDANGTTIGVGSKRIYLDLQSQPPDVAYPPRPVPGAIADLDVILKYCDFAENKVCNNTKLTLSKLTTYSSTSEIALTFYALVAVSTMETAFAEATWTTGNTSISKRRRRSLSYKTRSSLQHSLLPASGKSYLYHLSKHTAHIHCWTLLATPKTPRYSTYSGAAPSPTSLIQSSCRFFTRRTRVFILNPTLMMLHVVRNFGYGLIQRLPRPNLLRMLYTICSSS